MIFPSVSFLVLKNRRNNAPRRASCPRGTRVPREGKTRAEVSRSSCSRGRRRRRRGEKDGVDCFRSLASFRDRDFFSLFLFPFPEKKNNNPQAHTRKKGKNNRTTSSESSYTNQFIEKRKPKRGRGQRPTPLSPLSKHPLPCFFSPQFCLLFHSPYRELHSRKTPSCGE